MSPKPVNFCRKGYWRMLMNLECLEIQFAKGMNYFAINARIFIALTHMHYFLTKYVT